MKAASVRFLDEFLLKSKKTQYVVPVYQRNYSWEKNDQVNRLMCDIENLILKKDKTHFIGSVVYSQIKVDDVTERIVIDGQQRITTLFLLLYALCDVVNEQDITISKDIKKLYLENSEENEKYRLKLKPIVSDDEVYKYIANNDSEGFNNSLETSRVKSNYLYIKEYIHRFIDSGHTGDEVLDAINRLNVVYIELEENQGDNSQEIFETLNSTGLKLRDTDLIRNFILMDKDNDEQERLYKKYWIQFEKIISDPSKMEVFFRNYLASKKFFLPSKNRIYVEFKDFWKSAVLTKEDEEKMLNNIKLNMETYRELYISDTLTDGLKKEEYIFKVLKYDTAMPFILGMFELYKTKKINVNHLNNVLSIINTYFIRRSLAGCQMNDISRLFPSVLRCVYESCDQRGFDKIVDIVKTELVYRNINTSAFLPTDSRVESNLLKANFYILKNSSFYLQQVNGGKDAKYLDTLSFMYIMPKERKGEWEKATSHISDAEYGEAVNRLGNLTIVNSDDTITGFRSFAEAKKELFKHAHIKMNSEIINLRNWNIMDIEIRTKKLISKLLDLYPYIYSKEYDDVKKKKIIEDEKKKRGVIKIEHSTFKDYTDELSLEEIIEESKVYSKYCKKILRDKISISEFDQVDNNEWNDNLIELIEKMFGERVSINRINKHGHEFREYLEIWKPGNSDRKPTHHHYYPNSRMVIIIRDEQFAKYHLDKLSIAHNKNNVDPKNRNVIYITSSEELSLFFLWLKKQDYRFGNGK